MKPLILVFSLLFLLSCVTTGSKGWGEIQETRTQLCILNQAGIPVHVYNAENGSKQGTVSGSRGCVKLSHNVSDSPHPITLCVQNLESHGCVIMPSVIWGSVPTWSLHLGPWTNTWHMDVWSLMPAAAAD